MYLTSQLLDIGLPVVVVLTMADSLEKDGVSIDAKTLETSLGVPVRVVIASRKQGLEELVSVLSRVADSPAPAPAWQLPEPFRPDIDKLTGVLAREQKLTSRMAFSEAVTLLMPESDGAFLAILSPAARAAVCQTRDRLTARSADFATQIIEARYAWVGRSAKDVLRQGRAKKRVFRLATERVDKVIMHPFWGYVIFFGVMTLMFQTIFSLGQDPAGWIKDGIAKLGVGLTRFMPPGDLRDLINAGVLGGVGTTLAFLPQIVLLFFFISLLEDTGYMARAAFLMDRLMSKVGLHGKSFIPLLSSFACAIPGIMATRTIGDRKARLITILVAPLMSCSARLPVYFLMTSAFVPPRPVLKIGHFTVLNLQGATFVAMYFLGMIAAFCMAWLFHRTLLKGVAPSFLMELPPYRLPSLRTAILQMIERAGLFIRKASTIILAVSVVVWFLSTYPKHPNLPTSEAQLEQTYIGQIGKVIEPAIRPLGFDWKMGVGIASSFVAREVFVSTMGTVYGVEDPEGGNGQADLGRKMRDDRDSRSGARIFTPLVAVCLMVYYVLAMQCMSTVAVVRRETNGWRWPLFQIAYMTGLAWLVTFALYHAGRALGYG